MKPHTTKSQPCLNCGKTLSGATNVDGDEGPGPGDISACLYCGHLMEFDKDMMLVAPSDAAIVDIAGDQRLLTAMEVSRLWREEHDNQEPTP